jgi:hypothetical protein
MIQSIFEVIEQVGGLGIRPLGVQLPAVALRVLYRVHFSFASERYSQIPLGFGKYLKRQGGTRLQSILEAKQASTGLLPLDVVSVLKDVTWRLHIVLWE